MDAKAQQFYEKIKDALESEKLVLPTMPEVALSIRDSIHSNDCSSKDISDLLARDTALTTNFIRIANSPLYRGLEPLTNLEVIITRIGLKIVEDLVVSLALKQIFMATSDILDHQFRSTWATSIAVASISRALASNIRGLSAEQAMLAGLIHNVGTLPILVMAEMESDTFETEAELTQMIKFLRPDLGQLILQKWDFPEHLQNVPVDCYNLDRQNDDAVDYADIVQVSLIHGSYFDDIDDISKINSFKKLNIDPEINVVEIDSNKKIIEDTRQILG